MLGLSNLGLAVLATAGVEYLKDIHNSFVIVKELKSFIGHNKRREHYKSINEKTCKSINEFIKLYNLMTKEFNKYSDNADFNKLYLEMSSRVYPIDRINHVLVAMVAAENGNVDIIIDKNMMSYIDEFNDFVTEAIEKFNKF